MEAGAKLSTLQREMSASGRQEKDGLGGMPGGSLDQPATLPEETQHLTLFFLNLPDQHQAIPAGFCSDFTAAMHTGSEN